MPEPIEFDPMGTAFRDFQDGDKSAEIVVYADVAAADPVPIAYFFRSWKQMPKSEQMALDISRGKVLDVGAGSGCHALILQERGVDVLPMDISELSVGVMRERGLKNAVTGDIFNFNEGPFDTILMLMNGIGIAKTLKGFAEFLDHARTLLAPGGQLIVDSADIRYMFEEPDGSHRFDLKKEYYGEILYWIEYNGEVGDSFFWLYIGKDKLQEIATANGWECEILILEENNHYLARLTVAE